MPSKGVEAVAARPTLRDRARPATSSAQRWRSRADDVALCAIIPLLSDDAGDTWRGPHPNVGHPTAPAPTAAAGAAAAAAASAGTPLHVCEAGVLLSHAGATQKGLAILRAPTIACEGASESLRSSSAIRHMASSHPNGQPRVGSCPHVHRVARSRSAAWSLCGIPAAWSLFGIPAAWASRHLRVRCESPPFWCPHLTGRGGRMACCLTVDRLVWAASP